MIFYCLKSDKPFSGWIPAWQHLGDYKPEDFKRIKFMVNKTVYTEWSDEFIEAVRADFVWDRLLYGAPVDD